MSENVRAIERALAVLDCFTPGRRALTLAELSRQTGCPKSTLHRIMGTLARQQLVAYDADSERYSPGFGLLRYQRLFSAGNSLIQAALPHLVSLRDLSGETAALSLRYGFNRMYVEQVESNNQVRMSMEIGILLPISAGASGKAMLACLPEEMVQQVLEGGLQRITSHTITDPEALQKDLGLVRARGWATSLGERVPDSAAVGVAIMGGPFNPVGAISIAGPRARFRPARQAEIGEAVLRVARLLSTGIHSERVV